MNKIKWFISLLFVFSLSACAPVYYESAYYAPPGSTSYRHHAHRPYTGYSSGYGAIEVTLFTDHTYVGARSAPINLVVYDGDFVQIPVKNKHGHLKKLYAHYHRGDLHFDTSRQCMNIPGTSRFKATPRWDEGYRYNHISAGNDYDLSGYRMTVRNHDTTRRPAVREVNPKYKSSNERSMPSSQVSTGEAKKTKGNINVSAVRAKKNINTKSSRLGRNTQKEADSKKVLVVPARAKLIHSDYTDKKAAKNPVRENSNKKMHINTASGATGQTRKNMANQTARRDFDNNGNVDKKRHIGMPQEVKVVNRDYVKKRSSNNAGKVLTNKGNPGEVKRRKKTLNAFNSENSNILVSSGSLPEKKVPETQISNKERKAKLKKSKLNKKAEAVIEDDFVAIADENDTPAEKGDKRLYGIKKKR